MGRDGHTEASELGGLGLGNPHSPMKSGVVYSGSTQSSNLPPPKWAKIKHKLDADLCQ